MIRVARFDCLSLVVMCVFVALPVRADSPQACDSAETSVVTGAWGGDGIRLILTEIGGRLEYDCAAGTIDAPLRPDEAGNFEGRGTHVFERGGPVAPGQPPPRPHAARYGGWTNGTDMRLTITLPDKGQDIGTFSLRKGRTPVLDKCL